MYEQYISQQIFYIMSYETANKYSTQFSSLGNLYYLHFCKFVMAFEYSLSVHEQGGEETRAATLRSERRLSTTLLSKGIVLATPSAICHAASENPTNKILVND